MASIAEFVAALAAAGRRQGGARFGVIDIGSNSVRLVVFDSRTRTPAVFFNEKVLCALGEDLERTGRLSEDGKKRTLAALSRFHALTERMDLRAVVAVGTAAMREAEDGPAFVEEIERRVGLAVQVAQGADEARLAAQGVLLGDPDARGVVADMGGASMELVEIAPDGVRPGGVTTALGPLRLLNWGELSPAKRDARIDRALTKATDGRFRKAPSLYVLGGSWRAVVSCFMEKTGYPLRVLHGFSMPYAEALEAVDWAATLSPEAVAELAGVSERRAAVTPPAAAVLARLLRILKPKRLVLSAFGLREGILWEQLPASLRARDPLLDACEELETSNARMPGFGQELWTWLRGALEPFEPGEARLAKAACLLADANWRTHPDYRSRTSFELVTRNNLGGVDHEERLFIGAALLHRYKGGRRAMKAEPAMELLPLARQRRAEAVGRGVRLGAMLAGAAPGLLPLCPIRRVERDGATVLELTMSPEVSALRGEEVGKRLDAFASSLDLIPSLQLP